MVAFVEPRVGDKGPQGSPRHSRYGSELVFTDGASRLLRFKGVSQASALGSRPGAGRPVLLIPSMLQRWHILDLVPGESLVAAVVEAGFDVFVLDWGELADERHLNFAQVVKRIDRMARKVRRLAERWPAVVGYSQGGTLAAIHAALNPTEVPDLVLIAAPISFAHGGAMAPLVDPRLVDADLLADAGGVPPATFRAMVAMMHPGATLWSAAAAAFHPNPQVRTHLGALERWANDSVPLPPEVLRVWLGELVQGDALSRGRLAVGAHRVSLSAIAARALLVVADGDTICPPPATLALSNHVGCETLLVPGGHVSGLAGPGTFERVHQPVARWLSRA